MQKLTANLSALLTLILLLSAIGITASTAKAQTPADTAEEKNKALDLIKQQKYTEALPLLEKVLIAAPEDGESQFFYGFALLGKSKTVKDKEEQKQLNIRARKSFLKAKQLGIRSQLLDALLASLPADGVMKGKFSSNPDAEDLMNEAEGFFAQGKMNEALKAYQKALQLDPKIYEAALFAGDVYVQKEDFANAEIWYQKAIVINPNRETAYRYSATPLMKQMKYDLARDRYVEAYIVEPYNRFSAVGISQWAEATDTKIGHPKIDIPVNIRNREEGNTVITLGSGGKTDDGSFVWFGYGGSRALWQNGKDGKLSEKFQKAYPNETVYRHSLAEEFDALKTTAVILKERMNDKNSKVKQLDPQLAKLIKLYDAGLLEPYILLAMPDEGIAQDHAEYLRLNRDKLRRYVMEIVLNAGGK